MTALIITALSTAAQTLLYAGLAFGCGVIALVVWRWFDEIVLAANDVPDRRDDALGEVGEGQDFGLNHRKGQ